MIYQGGVTVLLIIAFVIRMFEESGVVPIGVVVELLLFTALAGGVVAGVHRVDPAKV